MSPRHSGAKEARIRLQFELAALILEVEDHGKGFRPAEGQTGIGLVAMRERAQILVVCSKFRRSPPVAPSFISKSLANRWEPHAE